MQSNICEDELLEKLWYHMEQDGASVLSVHPGANERQLAEQLCRKGLVSIDEANNTIRLTEQGVAKAATLIRAHRLAERLVCDVLHREFELSACEFEHTLVPEMVDSICTLLNHPRHCPHGKPIPQGECCRFKVRSLHSPIVNLTDLEVGQSAPVAYIECSNDQLLHRLDAMLIHPGAWLKLHQKYPTIVIECSGSSIALDESIAAAIRLWRPDEVPSHPESPPRGLHRFRWRHGHGKKPKGWG